MLSCDSHCSGSPSKLLLISVVTTILFRSINSQLSFTYSRFKENDHTIVLQGDAYHEHDSLLMLTKCQNYSVGRAIYSKYFHLWDKSSGKTADFTTHFSFIINPVPHKDPGDGITFFLARPGIPLPNHTDPGVIGLEPNSKMEDGNQKNQYPFVGIEFDTHCNPGWDPFYEHVAIDVNSMISTYTTEWFRNITVNRIYNATISFDSSTTNLSVSFIGYKNNTVVQQSLSANVNLKDYLPEFVQFGFSSSTGRLYEDHILVSWTFSSSSIPSVHRNIKWSAIVILIAILGFIMLVFWKMKNRSREQADFSFHNLSTDNEFEIDTDDPGIFCYEDLARATGNFAEENKLGEGGFGAVYKGYLSYLSIFVAIKKISKGSKQGIKEYASEVKIISQLGHKNLVKLIGCCHQKNDLLLIYEYLANGSLDLHLFKSESELTWKMRVEIARGIASGLLYLHEEWEQCVVHRDIKSSNVMLDANFVPKLGDFGLARLIEHSKGSKTTVLSGTMGYLAPEYVATGKASRKTDVFSFGVVVLEIVSGRRSLDFNYPYEQQSLVDWVWKLYETGNLLEAADPRLGRNFNKKEMERLITVGLWCVHPDFNIRPTMRQAMPLLDFEAKLNASPPQMTIATFPALPLLNPQPSSNTDDQTVVSPSAALLDRTSRKLRSLITPGTTKSCHIFLNYVLENHMLYD